MPIFYNINATKFQNCINFMNHHVHIIKGSLVVDQFALHIDAN
jgi:hypothetical protein